MGKTIGQLDLHILGQTKEEFEIEGVDEVSAISLDLALQCRRIIQITSRHLDQALYDNDTFIQALKTLIKRSRFSTIQILVQDSTPAVKSDHKLIALHQRFSSYIHIRKISKEYKNYNEAILMADETGFIYRQFADRYKASVNYSDPLRAKKLAEGFNEIWEVSEPDPHVRRLTL